MQQFNIGRRSYCLAGASELAAACDLVYVAEDAQIGYPAVRFGVPDMHFHAWLSGMRSAMETMLTGAVRPEALRDFLYACVDTKDVTQYKITWCGRFSVPFGLFDRNREPRESAALMASYAKA